MTDSNTCFFSFAFGLGCKNSEQNWLEVFYPQPLIQVNAGLISVLTEVLQYSGGNKDIEIDKLQIEALVQALQNAGEDQQARLIESYCANPSAESTSAETTSAETNSDNTIIVACFIEHDEQPQSVPEIYLKLHLLSHRLVKPHGTNLTGMFGLLPNVAWTNKGAVDVKELAEKQLQARLNGELLEVMSVDKFPKMANYVVPTGVRIAHTARVRLGAYIGEGTTIMHEGFVNFNAGTEGTAMIEGRISAGVVVAQGSDLGGGCSTMGTLSGGGNEIISVGTDCLIGANAGLGFPLGDRCTIEAGLYVTAGTKVKVFDASNALVRTVAARELSNKSDLLFRRNSLTGVVECRTNKSAIALNEELHSSN